MIFAWFRIFNIAEFEALNLVSKTYVLELEDIGEKEILVTKGDFISILYDGVFLSVLMKDENPFIFDGHAVFVDENQDVYLGIAQEEDT